MILNLYVDVQQGDDYVNVDVEGLHTGDSEQLGRLLASASQEEHQLKPIIFKSVALILFQDGHITDQDLSYYLDAIDEGNYEAVLDVMEFMDKM